MRSTPRPRFEQGETVRPSPTLYPHDMDSIGVIVGLEPHPVGMEVLDEYLVEFDVGVLLTFNAFEIERVLSSAAAASSNATP